MLKIISFFSATNSASTDHRFYTKRKDHFTAPRLARRCATRPQQ